MSFLKIKDPIKRDLIVEEFLKTKKNIQEKFITERLGDISAQRELSKLFKPITETQNDIKESLVSELRPIKESLKELYQRLHNFKPLRHLPKTKTKKKQ